MATLRRESPTGHVYTTENNAIVHIRQLIYTDDDQTSFRESQDSVKMIMMQFCSLVFHLHALDMQFTQNTENKLTTKSGERSLSKSSKVGKKRSWYIMNDNGTDQGLLSWTLYVIVTL